MSQGCAFCVQELRFCAGAAAVVFAHGAVTPDYTVAGDQGVEVLPHNGPDGPRRFGVARLGGHLRVRRGVAFRDTADDHKHAFSKRFHGY